MIDIAREQELLGELERSEADGAIADDGVGIAIDAELGGEMAGGGIIYRLGKEHGAGGIGAIFHHPLVELTRIDHAAAGDGEDNRGTRRQTMDRSVDPGMRERGQAGRDGEVGDGAGAPEPGIAAEVLHELGRDGGVVVDCGRFPPDWVIGLVLGDGGRLARALPDVVRALQRAASSCAHAREWRMRRVMAARAPARSRHWCRRSRRNSK